MAKLFGSFIRGFALGFVLVLIVCALTSCAADPVESMDTMTDDVRWCSQERPAYVWLSDAIKPECADATLAAIDWWRDQGVTYLQPISVPDGDIIRGVPQPRAIAVTGDRPADLSASGDTRIARLTTRCILGAEIRLATCRTQTSAHELGHALGLLHDPDPDNVMFRAARLDRDGPWGLTDAQREHVR